MRPKNGLWAKAIAGGAFATLLLAAGMALTIRSLDTVAAAQAAHLRAEEYEITLVERLRWSGEVMVSAGRGYLITGDPALRTRLLRATSAFVRGDIALRAGTLTAASSALMPEVEQDIRNFIRAQEELVSARDRGNDPATLVLMFEKELLPLQRKLGESLDRLVQYQEAALDDIYAQAAQERRRLANLMYGLLSLLVLVGLVATWHFARQIARAYGNERDALELARKALAARDEMFGIVAHDLRNPLGAISMKAALLRMGVDSTTARRHAESIEKVAMRMEYLIKSMLDVATMEAGQLSVAPEVWDLDELLREATELLAGLSASKEVRMEQTPKEARVSIKADRERVLQLLSNVLGNALKFTPSGSQVTIAVEQRHQDVCIAVSDMGPGIDAQHVPHVFDRFWKHETSGKKGTGLGLFIAKCIVEAHGGRIWIDTAIGGGATFRFTLPMA